MSFGILECVACRERWPPGTRTPVHLGQPARKSEKRGVMTHIQRDAPDIVGTELLEGFSGGVKELFQSATFKFVSHGRMLLESFLMICKKINLACLSSYHLPRADPSF